MSKLYRAVNRLMAEIGAQGEIGAHDGLVSEVMAALDEVDGGVPEGTCFEGDVLRMVRNQVVIGRRVEFWRKSGEFVCEIFASQPVDGRKIGYEGRALTMIGAFGAALDAVGTE